MTSRKTFAAVCTAFFAILTAVPLQAAVGLTHKSADSYYENFPLFHPYPDEGKAIQSIDRFGPVGMGIELLQPAFRMRIQSIEEGSPAAAAGSLKKGQFIESINGRVLKDIDPRRILGQIITDAEAGDGRVVFRVRDGKDAAVREVTVQIPVLGAYSDSWPLDCAKSDRILRNFADFLAANGPFAGPSIKGMGLLFMLSTGEEKDLEVARSWVRELVAEHAGKERIKTYPWFAGYGGPALCEYYLRTGDESILPLIEKIAASMKRNMYNGGWGGRGGCPFPYMGGGHMNAAGVHVVTFLLLAKECGVDVDEYTLQESLKQFFRYAGRGNTPYGDGKFRYDGRPRPNDELLGSWEALDRVAGMADFEPGKRQAPRIDGPFRTLTLMPKGRTGDPLWIWSGSMLMDLDRYQALEMVLKAIDGRDYLFVEIGGFSTERPADWQSPLLVLRRM